MGKIGLYPMILIRSYSQIHEADLARGLLEANQIPVELRGEADFTNDWLTRTSTKGVDLLVPKEHVMQALELLGSPSPDSAARARQMDRTVMVTVGWFVGRWIVVSVVLWALKGYRTEMLGPSIGVALFMNLHAYIKMAIFKK
jgi:hypothetical protein